MSDDERNRETHLFRLWLYNDQGPYLAARAMAADVADDDSDEYPRVTLADQLRDSYEEEMPEVEGVWADLLTLAFQRVDWIGLADELLADHKADNE